jgi:hypothetical protein
MLSPVKNIEGNFYPIFHRGWSGCAEELFHYRIQLEKIPKGVNLVYKHNIASTKIAGISPLDPFLNIAERLRLLVAVRGHHVELSLSNLAGHLDSPVSSMRTNLQNAILQLHEAGYLLRNHPGLTHQEAKSISNTGTS